MNRMSQMNRAEARAAWVAALRSGQYKQGRGYLANKGQFCCLGVACELAIADGVKVKRKDRPSGVKEYDGITGTMPLSVRQWLGLKYSDGAYKTDDGYHEENRNLACLNDNGYGFEAIAQLIESHPKGMFVADEDEAS